MFEIFVLFVNGIIFLGMACYALTCIFEPAVKKRWIVLACIAYLIITNAVFFEFESVWINLAVNMTAFFMLTFLYLGNVSTKLIFALLVYILGMLADGVAFLILYSI